MPTNPQRSNRKRQQGQDLGVATQTGVPRAELGRRLDLSASRIGQIIGNSVWQAAQAAKRPDTPLERAYREG